jgi:aspartate/methionine/tyrosine aminotransferase
MDTSSNIKCTSQEMDANALAEAIDPKMQLCPRMGNPENPTGASRQGNIKIDKRVV